HPIPPLRAAMAGWAPTHARVTVLRARGLRSKAAAGGSDAYAVMALGRDKFRTSVAERCRGEPLWREEATFELPPSIAPLRITVLHRALTGADKFLGRAELDLAALRDGGGRRHTRWYKLRSKPGKKEKERGEVEVDIQFMRSSMTASMFDLSVKDKPRSPFGKLKDKLKGKRSSGQSDTASAIVPSTTHSPADSEDEAVEKEKKKSKFKALFSKPGLQKTLSQSMSVLPTEQPLSQKVRLRPSDFQPQWDEEESGTSPTSERESPSPLFKSRKTALLDSRQLTQGTTNHTKKEGLSFFSGLKSKNDPVSKSSLCINGSHVYMEETTTKDNTPTSSPSPLNFRRKQLFASEENLSSRSTKPEETGRTSPSQPFSGPTSLETFKSMTLPSYKLLSSEEHLDTGVPPSTEAVRETRKPEHKKSALLSLVTGRKEVGKTGEAESIPDRTLQSEENTIQEEKSEEESKCHEPPADLGRGDPSGDTQGTEDTSANKWPLSPGEEERKPEKAAVPAKTKAVKPRLGLSPEEEPKATLPTLAPDPLPAFLSVHCTSSANNPFISKTGQKVQGPDSENITGSSASLTSPAFAAELWNGKNPFTPEWDRASTALDPGSIAHFPSSHHLSASAPKAPLPGQVSARGNNPFAADWGQGPESSAAGASWGLSLPPTPSLPSDCHFNDNNPFVPKREGQAGVPGFQTVPDSSPSCLPRGEDCSSAGRPGHDASESSAGVAVTGDVTAVPEPPGTFSDPPLDPAGLAPKQHCDSPQLHREDSLEGCKLTRAELVPFPESKLREKQEVCGGKQQAESAPPLEPQATPLAKNDSLSQVKPALGVCLVSPREVDAGRAGSEVPVPPRPAPRRAVALRKCPPASQAELKGDVPSSGVKSMPGLLLPAGEASAARGCFPQSGSSEAAPPPGTLGGDRPLNTEGDDDLSVGLTNLRSAIPIPGSKVASLPVILEGGSDDELLGDCQESSEVTAGDKSVSRTQGLTPLQRDLGERPVGALPAEMALAALQGEGGVPGACKPGRSPMLPAGMGAPRVSIQGADSGLGVTSHSQECNRHFEKQQLETSVGIEEPAECDLSEPSASFSSLSSPCHPCSSSHSLLSGTPSHRAESPKKPRAEGFADKAGNSGKKKLLQARVSPSETFPSQTPRGGETLSPKHRLHPVKPMNAMANKAQSRNLNVISTMNEKLLEMSVKKYDPSDPAYAYAQLTHDELIQLVLKQKETISRKDLQVRELEDYIDNLLVRVIEETPNILRVSMSGNRKAGKM
ncbi:RFIP1 protein, partial [Formicarius rufipectus]|nr:RFIP1 protein [Formicarius rufipectus]